MGKLIDRRALLLGGAATWVVATTSDALSQNINTTSRLGLFGGKRRAPIPTNYDMIAFGDSRVNRGSGNTLTSSGLLQVTTSLGIQSWLATTAVGRILQGQYSNFGIDSGNSTQAVAEPRLSAFNDNYLITSLARNLTRPDEFWRGASSRGSAAAQETNCGPFAKDLTALAAHEADIIWDLLGTNDPISNIPPLTTIANKAAAIDAAAAAGKIYIMCNEMPRGILPDGNPANGSNADYTGAFPNYLVSDDANRFAVSRGFDAFDFASGSANARRNCIVINTRDEFIDLTIQPDPLNPTLWRNKAGYEWDGLHPSQYGMKRTAAATVARLAAVWSGYSALPNRVPVPTANGFVTPSLTQPYVNRNPVYTNGTDGIVTGTWAVAPLASGIPQDWAILGIANTTGLSCVVTKGTNDPTFGNYTQLVITGTIIAGNLATIHLREGMTSTTANAEVTAGRIAITDKLRAAGWRKIASGSTGLYSVELQTYCIEATANKSFTSRAHVAQNGSFVRDIDGNDAGNDEWQLAVTDPMVLNDANMTPSPGAFATFSGNPALGLLWLISLGRVNAGSLQTVSATIRFAKTGIYRS